MRQCVQCGVEFETIREVHFFCSDECRKAARGTEYRKQRSLVLLRDGYCCTECGSTDHLECHHKQPLCYGGDHSLGNLQTLCRKCHKSKHRKWRSYGGWAERESASEVYDHAA
jgi:5-methylcytosine-specific restriction endonuclease McrA